MNELDMDYLLQEADRLKDGNTGGGGGGGFYDNIVRMPKQKGAVVVRLLGPAAPGMFDRPKSHLFQYTRIHNVNEKSLHCLKTLEGNKWVGECPICRFYNWLWQQSEQTRDEQEANRFRQRARALKPIERYYYNCIVLEEKDENGVVSTNVGPKILSIGKTLHKIILNGILGSKELSEPALGNVTCPKTGRDFKIIKDIKPSDGIDYPDYSRSKFLDPSAVDPDMYKTWMENLHDLQALRVLKDPEELKIELKKHEGVIPKEDASGFDPSEFQVQTSKIVVNTPASAPVSKPKVEASAPVVSSEVSSALGENQDSGLESDEDFLNALRDIG